MCKLLLPLIAAGALAAQIVTPGPQVLTFLSSVDDSDQPYAIYVPKPFDPARRYPLVISLHGSGSNHRLNLRRVFGKGNLPLETDSDATHYFPALKTVDFIVASPFARGSMGYQGIPESDVYAVLEDVKRRFPIDEDRVYLTGLSMGGGGTLWLGLTRPDVWAAIAPVCASTPPWAEELAGNALNVPVRLFHGDQDPAVPVESSRRWHKQFLDLGVKAEYVEYPGVRHNSWDPAYKDGAIFDWFANFQRQRHPERVRFATRAYKYGSAYWVKLDGIAPGALASIDARFTGKNRLEVATAGVDGFTLELTGHPIFAAGSPLAVTIDGTALRARPAATVSFRRTAKGWQAGRLALPATAKRAGAEGPLPEALAARHIYVYGTADQPGDEELKRRRDTAATASDWSSPRARLMLSFAVKADRQVTGRDLETSNLVLFGTRETNSLIAKYADRFPLALERSAADYGLVFVAPIDHGHYAVVSSGLPWWTGAEAAKRPGLRYEPLPYRVLQTFPDFVLFKGSLGNVLAEGTFDREWYLPAEAAEKVKASGTVMVPQRAAVK
ncbi:MAG TPA: dienelactone hydrolase family protein [Bryobacteraceae bacterium]|nr:dienelactone hydrolase family protein [Bryobacteraceae bacterium]